MNALDWNGGSKDTIIEELTILSTLLGDKNSWGTHCGDSLEVNTKWNRQLWRKEWYLNTEKDNLRDSIWNGNLDRR